MKNAWSLVALVLGLAMLANACGSSHSKSQGVLGTTELAYDPARAPIVFLPGLLASDLGCGPSGNELNVWPGEIAPGTSFADWSVPFDALGIVNAVGQDGTITSRTTASDQCGTMPYENGTAAENEPVPLHPSWCSPESTAAQGGPEDPCSVSFASSVYNVFAIDLEAAIADNGNVQTFTSFPWDWRLSPADQAASLDATLAAVTEQSGVKATVIAHSFGNLLFREWVRYAEEQGRDAGERVGRFVSVAGPWWGVGTGWTHPAYGSLQPNLGSALVSRKISVAVVSEVFSSSPGIYWLFPTQAYDEYLTQSQDHQGEHWLAVPKPDRIGSQWVAFDDVGAEVATQLDTCPQSDVFPCASGDLYDQAAQHFPAAGFDRSGIDDFVGIVGAGMATDFQFCHGCEIWPDGSSDGDLTTTSENGESVTLHRVRYVNGDENVPVFSAIQGDDPANPPGDKVDFYFTCGIDHIGLMQNQDVLDQVIPYLTGEGNLVAAGAFSSTPCDLSVSSQP